MKTLFKWAASHTVALFWGGWLVLVTYVAIAFGPSVVNYTLDVICSASLIPAAWQQDHGARDRAVFIKTPLLQRMYAWGSKPATKWHVLLMCILSFTISMVVPR